MENRKESACSAYAPESAIAMGPPMCSSFWRGGHLGFTCDGVPAALWPRDAEEKKINSRALEISRALRLTGAL